MSWSASRRSFLKLGAAAASAAVLSRGPAFSAPLKTGDFPLGLQTYSFRAFPADKALELASELGLVTAETFQAHFSSKSSPEQIAAMRAHAKKLGIQILSHGVNPFTKNHEENKRWFEFAKAAGLRNLTADPAEDSFDSLDKLVAQYDIRIAIHNHGPGARYDKIADVLNAVSSRHPNIGACADLGHFIRSGEDPVRAIQLFKGRLFGVHLKDFAEQKRNAKGVILGKGHLDVNGVFKALRQVDFPKDACLAIEYEENPEDPLDDVRQCAAIAAEAAQRASS